MERLNSNQRAILEENQELIKDFLYYNRLKRSDYYSIVTDSLVKAILDYDESKSKLSTLFDRIAKNDVAYEQRKVRKEVLGISGDYANNIISLSDADKIGYRYEFEEYTEVDKRKQGEDFDVSAYLSYLEDFEIKICKMLYEGRVQREIAEAFGVSQQSISKRIRIIRRKIKEERANESRAKEA